MSEPITIQYHDATLTVRPATIGSAIKRDQIIAALHDEQGDAVARYLFACAASQTTIEGELGWEAPHTGDSSATVRDKFVAWLDLPADLGDRWMRAVHAANAPKSQPEHQPEVGTDADPE